MTLLRSTFSVVANLLFWTLLGTMSAIVFFFLYGIVVLTVLFGHPLFFPFFVLGPLAGAIGGPVFGAVYGTTVLWRGQAKNRGRAALLAGALGGVIFSAVGAGFHSWEASQRSYHPTTTKRPVPNNAEGGRVAADQRSVQIAANSGSTRIRATPDGGRIIEHRPYVSDSDAYMKAAFAVARITVPGGFLFGALFGAMIGTRQRKERFGIRPGTAAVLDDNACSPSVTPPIAAVNLGGIGKIGISVLILLGGLIVLLVLLW